MGYISEIRKKVGHDPVFMPFSGCVIIKDNKILLQKRTDDGSWAIHGGALDLGETFEEALKREVREELNIELIDPVLTGIYSGEDEHHLYPNNDEIYGVGTVYLVRNYIGEPRIDHDEVLELKWFNIDNLPANIHETDVRSIRDALKYYKEH